MKLIFLDFDGVINTEKHIYERHRKRENILETSFDPNAMKYLKEIVDKTEAEIVVTSTWRLGRFLKTGRWEEVEDEFRKYDLPDFEGYTPDIDNAIRGDEIQKWLDTEGRKLEVNSFVIIDDDNDMGIYTETNLVQTDRYYGIRDIDAKKAIEILNK